MTKGKGPGGGSREKDRGEILVLFTHQVGVHMGRQQDETTATDLPRLPQLLVAAATYLPQHVTS